MCPDKPVEKINEEEFKELVLFPHNIGVSTASEGRIEVPAASTI